MKRTRRDKRDAERGINKFAEVLKVMKHYFPKIFKKMASVSDPRNPSYITYKQSDLLMTTVLSHCCQIESRRRMNIDFNTDQVIENLKILYGDHIQEVPHGDTINDYLKEVSIEELRKVTDYLFQELLDKKLLEEYRINNKYYHLILDGTQLHRYKQQHIANSLTKKCTNGEIDYCTDVLIGIIRMGEIVIPIDFEMIENETLFYNKQDCEIKAAKRLLERIKKKYKRLLICLSGDALYFSESILNMCADYKWQYLITYKKGAAPSVEEYYKVAKQYNDTSKVKEAKNEKEYTYEFYNGVEYRNHKVNIMELHSRDTTGKEEDKYFCYATSLKLTINTIKRMMMHGRGRWKIENNEIRELKTIYQAKHAFTYNENALKCNFLLMQTAHLIMQLVEYYEKSVGIFKLIKTLCQEIKEALRNQVLSAQDIEEMNHRFQIRKPFSSA